MKQSIVASKANYCWPSFGSVPLHLVIIFVVCSLLISPCDNTIQSDENLLAREDILPKKFAKKSVIFRRLLQDWIEEKK